MNLTDQNTFQAVLFADGTIRFVYGGIGLQTAVVGIAPGSNAGPAIETDLSAAAGDVKAPAIYENFIVAGVGPASGNHVNVVLDGAQSSLAPTSYHPAPQPFVVNDDFPAEVTITVTGSLIY